MITKRSVGIDLLRIFGGTAVIFVHVYGAPPSHQWIYPWNVPLFFILSGYLWKPSRSFLGELRTRARTLALPYVVWLVVIALVVTLVPTRSGRYPVSDLAGAVIGGSNIGGPFGTLWFISALFFVCLLYRLVDRIPWPAQVVVAIVAVVIGYLFGVALAATPLGIGQAIPLLAFLIAGRGVAKLVPRIRYPILTGAGLLAVSAAVLAWVPLTSFDLKDGDWGTPAIEPAVAVVICTGMIVLAERISLPPRLGAFTSLVATGAIAVSLGHLVVVVEGHEDLLHDSVILLAAVLISWVGATLLRLSPLSLPFTGAFRYHADTTAATAANDVRGDVVPTAQTDDDR